MRRDRPMDFLTPILVACVASSGFWAFLQWLIGRKSSNSVILEQIQALKKDVDNLGSQMGADRASNARVRILRFDDELLEGRGHSKDSFDQCLLDIDTYNKYCEAHRDFKNSITSTASEHIKDCYKKRLEKHDFL
ncbi:MAG: hypothetical protein IJ680_06815 [Paludibacteraceae bacterium]|nr:hypothetical protein [Paludibacteraceae bacterium]